jgi:transposase
MNALQQQAKFDDFMREFNVERPHEALDMKTPAERYAPSSRPYAGLPELIYPLHDRDVLVTACGRICMHRKRINVSTVLAGQRLGIKEVDEGIWLVSFMSYDLGFVDLEQKTLQPLDNPFGPRLWAWRRNFRYGTLICDLERRKTIALLPDREPATAEAWLRQWPGIKVIARDRGGAYALAAQRATPNAVQVADRWHLMENASAAFLDAVRKSMRPIRAAIGAATIDTALLTSAERLQYEGYLRREETNASILTMAGGGAAIKEIRRRTGFSRKLIRAVLRGQRSDIFRARQSSLEPWLPWLDEQWAAGQRNGAELWRDVKRQGFRGCLRVVGEWAGRRRRADKAQSALGHAPAARTIARLLTTGRDYLTKAETLTVAAIENGVVLIAEARDAIAAFQDMIRRKANTELDAWLDRAKGGLLAAFANGMTKDKAAVTAAIESIWSNGQTEGQICKLKLVKRQMYGRGNIDLLQARVIGLE